MNKQDIIKQYQKEVASKGGKAVLKKRGKEWFSKLGKKSAKLKQKRKLLTVNPQEN